MRDNKPKFYDFDLGNKDIITYIVSIPRELKIEDIQKYTYILDEDEIYQFTRYKVEKKKIEFLLGRILLKGVLGKILKKNANDISFTKNKYGKLFLKNNSINSNIYFNLSHTDGMVVCGITKIGKIGIDVERTNKDYLETMEMVFVSKEIDYVNSQDNVEKKKNAFYKIWTRKEAFMKLTGKGFSLSPLTFTVPFNKSVCFNGRTNYDSYIPSLGYIVSIAIESIYPDLKYLATYYNIKCKDLIKLISVS